MTTQPILHLPDQTLQPIGKGRQKKYHPLCGVSVFTADVAYPGGDETLADCKRCLKIAKARQSGIT